MSDEIKKVEEKQCFCKSEFFRNFLTVALGTFVGGFCAISLHCALNKPPVIMPINPMMGQHMMYHHHHQHGDFHKKMMKQHFMKEKFIKEQFQNEGLKNKLPNEND